MAFINRNPDYKDLDLDFLAHPTTKDIVKKTGVDAIKRAVRNLILTNFYERPFRPWIGSNAQKLLFDNITPMTANFLTDAIREVIRNYEPRVEVLNVRVSADPDNNGYNAYIEFMIINRQEPASFNVFLERIR